MDPNPSVTCVPPSGSVFALGDTTVTCTAGDLAGNSATASFAVHVRGAAEQLSDLAVAVDGAGARPSLVQKVVQARAAVAANATAKALALLRAFDAEVAGLAGRQIPSATASELISAAQRIGTVLA